MKTVKGTSATGSASRVIHIRKHKENLMLSIVKPGDLFNRSGAIVVSAEDLLKQIAAASKEK